MKILAAQSRAGETSSGLAEIASRLEMDRHGTPDFLALHFGVGLDAADLHQGAQTAFGATALHGGSSCLGIMGSSGVDIGGSGLGCLRSGTPMAAMAPVPSIWAMTLKLRRARRPPKHCPEQDVPVKSPRWSG
jgi:hypothetical protein